MSKPKTQSQIDKATDKRLLKTYGVGLGWYYTQLALQNGGCAICRRPPTTRRLHIDHDHAWKKVKIKSVKIDKVWVASAYYTGKEFSVTHASKREVVRQVRNRLKLWSVRGLLCYSHNAGLQKFQDDPKLFRAAADYLEAHQGRN